jgi:hypothetical protein
MQVPVELKWRSLASPARLGPAGAAAAATISAATDRIVLT